MSVEVVMPQMGESITEGTVSKWLKQVGERVEKDEALLEISTDKVDAEVPSPGEGTLLEIRHQEGDTVEVGTVLAVIGAEGKQPAAAAGSEPPASAGGMNTKTVEASITEKPLATKEHEQTQAASEPPSVAPGSTQPESTKAVPA